MTSTVTGGANAFLEHVTDAIFYGAQPTYPGGDLVYIVILYICILTLTRE